MLKSFSKFWSKFPFKGTLLDASVAFVMGLIGLWLGSFIHQDLKELIMTGIGLVAMVFGIKMFMMSKNMIIVIIAIALGGVIGFYLGIPEHLSSLKNQVEGVASESSKFWEAFLTTSILCCIGPMTFLGCIQDAVDGKSELLTLKSLFDGTTLLFFAAALGPGAVATAGFILVFQSTLSLLARPLRRFLLDPYIQAELSATGGVILVAICLGITKIKDISSETFLPAVILAPLLVLLFERSRKKEVMEPEGGI